MMSLASRKYKKSYAFVLLKIAEGDLDSSKALFQAKIGRPENILFHTQQAIEKTIKSVLCFNEIPILYTHDLEALLAILPKNISPPDSYALNALSQYASIRRYEEGQEELSHEDYTSCIQLGERILNWGKSIIK